ncbi:MAG TPA: glycosyltransferase family 39 protein [Synergistaceae bacterium]|nr:glycosyltransferase family 39 protein [Synergistaceae bacterium]
MRCAHLDWDGLRSYHPDEMNLSLAAKRIDFPQDLDPRFYSYNGLPIYLSRLTGEILRSFTGDSRWTESTGFLSYLARWTGALLSSFSLLLFYRLGKWGGGDFGGLGALVLSAFSPGFIQTAHYGVTENLLLFEILLITLVTGILIRSEKPAPLKGWALLGFLGGLALGTKTTAAVMVLFPWVLLLLRYIRGDSPKHLLRGLLLCAFLGGVTFLAVSPYSLLRFQEFLRIMRYEGGIVKGTVEVPYTLQFTGTSSLLWIKNLLWHQGPAITLLGIPGAALLTVSMLRRRSSPEILPLLLFSALYALLIWNWHAKFIRYTLPLAPGLILGASWLLAVLRRSFPKTGKVLAVLALGSTLFWGSAVGALYWYPSTRTEASEWIHANLPSGSLLLVESWDYHLPASVPGKNRSFQFRIIPAPDRDTRQKAEQLAAFLEEGDYLILASRRNWGNLSKLPEKYPLMHRYYRALFDGSLGYEETISFASYPGFGKFRIRDEKAEETFRVFDHPTVRIFRNRDHTNRSALLEVLLP